MDIFEQRVNNCYKEILGRDADKDGLNTYSSHLKKGKTSDWLKNILKNSPEYEQFKGKSPETLIKNEKPIEELYPNLKNMRPKVEPIKPKVEPIKPFVPPTKEQILETQVNDIFPKKVNPEEIVIINSKNTTNLNIFLCCRDNEYDLCTTLGYLRIMERKLQKLYKFHYYIMENDSKDDTPYQIIDFFKYANGRYRIEKIDKRKWGTVAKIDRVKDMAEYRNMMKELCRDWNNSEYSFIIDTGVKFKTDIIEKMLNLMKINKDWAMLTPFGTVGNTKKYYDTFAFEPMEGNLGKFKQEKEENFEVKSAFGGFVCVKTEAMKESNWGVIDGLRSEHNKFCEGVKKYGKIICASKVYVQWTP